MSTSAAADLSLREPQADPSVLWAASAPAAMYLPPPPSTSASSSVATPSLWSHPITASSYIDPMLYDADHRLSDVAVSRSRERSPISEAVERADRQSRRLSFYDDPQERAVPRSRSDERHRQREVPRQHLCELPTLSSSAVAAAAAAQVPMLFSDASYAPQSFNGAPSVDAEKWLRRFQHYVQFRQLSAAATIQLLQLLLTDAAADWLEALPIQDKFDLQTLYRNFTERFATPDILRWRHAQSIFERHQLATETVDAYITDVVNLAKKVPIQDPTIIRFALLKGFKPYVRRHVLQTGVDTLEGTIKAARVAEAAAADAPTENTEVTALSKDVRELVAAFKELQQQTKTRQPTPERVAHIRSPSPRPRSPRRVQFADQSRPEPTQQDAYGPRSPRSPVVNTPMNWSWPEESSPWQQQSGRVFYGPTFAARPGPPMNTPRYQQPPPQQPQFHQRTPAFNNQVVNQSFPQCRNCGRFHVNDFNMCPARGLQCWSCGRFNHTSRCCRSTQSSNFSPQH